MYVLFKFFNRITVKNEEANNHPYSHINYKEDLVSYIFSHPSRLRYFQRDRIMKCGISETRSVWPERQRVCPYECRNFGNIIDKTTNLGNMGSIGTPIEMEVVQWRYYGLFVERILTSMLSSGWIHRGSPVYTLLK